MADQDPLAPYLRAWADARAEGRNPTPEELCRDRPDLAPALAARIKQSESRTEASQASSEPEPFGSLRPPIEGDYEYHPTQSRSAPVLPAEDEPEFPPQVGHYKLVQMLGKGGMGAVFRAEDLRLGRQVAIKLILPSYAAQSKAKARFEREARAQAALDHDNITPIYQVGEHERLLFIVMPLLQGETLRSRIKREGALPLKAVLKIGRELAEGLSAAHAKLVVHRDMKPGNVWLEGDLTSDDPAERFRRCRILDFGLVARANEEANARVTGAGEVLGTPAYMSPEQAAGMAVDEKTDLFSLGVILYELVTGKQPFEGTSVVSSLINVATVTPPPPRAINPDVPEPLSDLVERLMSKTPGLRPANARAVAEEFRRLADTLVPPTGSMAPLKDRPRKPASPLESTSGASGGWSEIEMAPPGPGPGLVESLALPEPDRGDAVEAVKDTKRGLAAGTVGGGKRDRGSGRTPAPADRRTGEEVRKTPPWVFAAAGLTAAVAVATVVYVVAKPKPDPNGGPKPPPTPEVVEVRIRSTPDGAAVIPVESAAVKPPAGAMTPATYSVKAEKHEVIVRKPGYEDQRVTIDPAARQDYAVELTPVNKGGPPQPPPLPAVTIRLKTHVPGAIVRAVGPVPIKAEQASDGEYVFPRAPAKLFTARVEAEGYVPRDVSVDVDRDKAYSVTLIPLRMRVVLKPFPDGATAEFTDPAEAQPVPGMPGVYDTRRTPHSVRVTIPGRRDVDVAVSPPPGDDREVVVPVPLRYVEIRTDGVGIVLHRIPAGRVEMSNRHWAELTKPYYIGRTEVTRGQFQKFVEARSYRTDADKATNPPSKNTWRDSVAGFVQTEHHPVVHVSWNDAVAFCEWMTEKEGRVYRLPTEAEWEYAARAGSAGLLPFPVGDTVVFANVADASYSRLLKKDKKLLPPPLKGLFFPGNDNFTLTAPVGTYLPNDFGLVDAYGNALEWCQDWYGDVASLATLPEQDPVQRKENTAGLRLARGGSFGSGSEVELIGRFPHAANTWHADTGFRVVVEIPAGGK
jgi:serine/threonine protein kinase/formylglycine-generating enzyme required for sulfatase activity